MKLVDIGVSKSPAGNGVRVRVPPAAPIELEKAEILAYIVGVALGDGNLSCPNGRATRLRVTCDTKYPRLIKGIRSALRKLLPTNKVSLVYRKDENCLDISVYSNRLNEWMPWKVGKGSKAKQRARVPEWIMQNTQYMKVCLRGLIQTDGCIYIDRGYPMVNFANSCVELAEDAREMCIGLGYKPSFMAIRVPTGTKYTVRIARNTKLFIQELKLYKA